MMHAVNSASGTRIRLNRNRVAPRGGRWDAGRMTIINVPSPTNSVASSSVWGTEIRRRRMAPQVNL